MRARASFSLLLILSLTEVGCAHRKATRERPPRPSAITNAPLQFVFFDLGQADAMLVVYRGHTLLMDAGESRDPDDQNRFHAIGKTLEALTGARHLDTFVLSHYHQDHVGDSRENTGLWGMLASDGVTIGTLIDRGEEIFGDNGSKGDTQKAYEKAVPGWLQSGKVKQHKVARLGDLIELGESPSTAILRIEVVAANGSGVLEALSKSNPSELETFPASENDYSLSLKFTFGDFELFSGGDLTGQTLHRQFGNHREGYHDIESTTAARVGDVEVYRVDHHGSDHSSSACFLNVLHPEVSIISSGENNYGHPAIKVFDNLSALGHVFITGGADVKVKSHVEHAIIGGNITVMVDETGRRYSVNGRDFRSKSEEQERERTGGNEKCPP
jgi:beta-lactamase superfamily II metal-dependent hydrolase